ncbi:hypothetical protein RHGRI_007333 [Rhododendron griersonianum]|uniref:Uncharacterized protein n=1 Tax=Rhododendron griersonianum TaxID=479676 RepID=A0AAV6KXU8_9ERIC|nr:hypothetical protein RHGRI_007333 [Rhododendron griersonianum]
MASPSNINTSSPTEKYPCPMEFNVLDFVPKLLSERDYEKWKILMEDFIKKQGLIGFIDDTAKEDIDNQDYYKAWKRSDDLVQRWILATLTVDIRLFVLGWETATAKELWTVLEQTFDPTSSLWQYDEEKENRVTRYLPLHKAVVKGDWDEAMAIIQQDPAAVRAAITSRSHTALHVAIGTGGGGRTHFVRMLLEKMTPHDVERTTLHKVAICGTIEEAEISEVFESRVEDSVEELEKGEIEVASGAHNILLSKEEYLAQEGAVDLNKDVGPIIPFSPVKALGHILFAKPTSTGADGEVQVSEIGASMLAEVEGNRGGNGADGAPNLKALQTAIIEEEEEEEEETLRVLPIAASLVWP